MKSKYCQRYYESAIELYSHTCHFSSMYNRLSFYNALGSRKIGLKSWNPLKLFRGFRELSKRLKRKNISGNMKGDGIVQGGIIIFNDKGQAQYAYREETGSEVPIDDIIAAVKMVKANSGV